MSRGSLPPLEDDFSRALLGSAEADAPSHAAYVKAAAALGIGVGLGVGASLPASAAVAVGAAGAASAAGVARWSSSLGAKLLALGVSGALIAGAGALLLGRSPPVTPQTSPAPALHPARARSERLPAAPALSRTDRDLPVSPSVSPSALPSVLSPSESSAAANSAGQAGPSSAVRALPVRRIAHPAAAHGSSARISTGSSLAEQVQSLDRARVALGSGDSSSALREIAHYRAKWPDGVFLTEASVLEIEALAARGERALTAKRAADFVAAHPDSPQADRLRALILAKKR